MMISPNGASPQRKHLPTPSVPFLRGLGEFLQGLEELLHLSHLFLISSGHSQHGAVGDLDL